MTVGSKHATIDTKKLHTGCNSTERKKEKKKLKVHGTKRIKTKLYSGSQEKRKASIKAKIKKSTKALDTIKIDLKNNFKNHTRNKDDSENGTIEDLSTIIPRNAKKNQIDDCDLSIKFTDDNLKSKAEIEESEITNQRKHRGSVDSIPAAKKNKDLLLQTQKLSDALGMKHKYK